MVISGYVQEVLLIVIGIINHRRRGEGMRLPCMWHNVKCWLNTTCVGSTQVSRHCLNCVGVPLSEHLHDCALARAARGYSVV